MRTPHALAIAGALITTMAWGQTTVELTAQAKNELHGAESYKSNVLADLRKTLPRAQQRQLDAAETAWEKYRDASVELIQQQYEGGTAAGLFAANLELRLTKERATVLESYFAEGYESGQADGTPVAGDVRTFDGIEFCWIPAGTFTMGSFPHDHPDGDPARIHDEIPHSVTISKGFWMGRYEVTQGEWMAVMGSNPSEITGNDRLPVETVDWNDCQAFVARLNEGKPGAIYRLPTEAEWEYACRAGTKTPYHFGTTLTIEQANLHGGPGKTVAVGSYPANAWNLHDMHGNVEEWCQDFRREYTEAAQTDPQGPATGKFRNMRGGSWRNSEIFHRASFRNGNEPGLRHAGVGFRLVRVAE